jgi:hypothetical protein
MKAESFVRGGSETVSSKKKGVILKGAHELFSAKKY